MKYRVYDLIGENCTSQKAGKQIYDLIYPQLQAGNLVELDFTDVRRFLTVFFNFAIGQLLRDIKGDIFLVDTNVWYWLTYPPASLSLTAHQSTYSNYITDALIAGATLCCSGLSLAELAHIIEREEKKLSSYRSSRIDKKEYRHNYPSERAKVFSRVTSAWNRVKNIYSNPK